MACSRLFKDKYTIRQLIEKNDKIKKMGWYKFKGPKEKSAKKWKNNVEKWTDIRLRFPKKKLNGSGIGVG